MSSNRFVEFIKPAIRDLPNVSPPSGNNIQHRMHFNENPFDLSPELREEVIRRISECQWSYYPSYRPYEIIEKLGAYHNVPTERVVVANSSSDLLRVIISSIVGPGDHLITHTPTFGSYRSHAKLQGANVHEVATYVEDGFALPVDQLIESAQNYQAKLVVICAPNNPTGTIHPISELEKVVASSDALVLIDEAYAQFSGQDLIPLLDKYDNLILARTFSKAFAMAGLRIGYSLSSEAVANEFMKVSMPFTINIFSETATLVALEHPEHHIEKTQRIVNERQRLAEILDQRDELHVYPSGTNFLLVRVGETAQALVDYLRTEYGILISNMGRYPELSGHIRISLGTPEQNDLLVRAVSEFPQ